MGSFLMSLLRQTRRYPKEAFKGATNATKFVPGSVSQEMLSQPL